MGDPNAGRGPLAGQPDGMGSRTIGGMAAALAIQAWFRINSTRGFRLGEDHRKACDAIGFDPQVREFCIRILPDEQNAAMQQAFMCGQPATGKNRALQAMNYKARLSSVAATDG